MSFILFIRFLIRSIISYFRMSFEYILGDDRCEITENSYPIRIVYSYLDWFAKGDCILYFRSNAGRICRSVVIARRTRFMIDSMDDPLYVGSLIIE